MPHWSECLSPRCLAGASLVFDLSECFAGASLGRTEHSEESRLGSYVQGVPRCSGEGLRLREERSNWKASRSAGPIVAGAPFQAQSAHCFGLKCGHLHVTSTADADGPPKFLQIRSFDEFLKNDWNGRVLNVSTQKLHKISVISDDLQDVKLHHKVLVCLGSFQSTTSDTHPHPGRKLGYGLNQRN